MFSTCRQPILAEGKDDDMLGAKIFDQSGSAGAQTGTGGGEVFVSRPPEQRKKNYIITNWFNYNYLVEIKVCTNFKSTVWATKDMRFPTADYYRQGKKSSIFL